MSHADDIADLCSYYNYSYHMKLFFFFVRRAYLKLKNIA